VSLQFGTTILSTLAWAVIPTVLQLCFSLCNTVKVAASNKTASVVILQQSLSTLTYAVTNWWPTGPRPVALHHRTYLCLTWV